MLYAVNLPAGYACGFFDPGMVWQHLLTPEAHGLLPVPERLRCARSPGAQRMAYLSACAAELDALPAGRELPYDYDRRCYDVACQLREQGAYLIAAGF